MANISVVITTLNEEPNIERAVRSALRLGSDVAVIDSGSTDRTCRISESLGARVIVRPFDDMASQRNAALRDGGLRGTFVLVMDADEEVTEAFARELHRLLDERPEIDGVRICRRFHFWGRWVRAASHFPRFIDRVVRLGVVDFVKEGHGEVFRGGSSFAVLDEPLHDEDLKPLAALIDRQNRYAVREAAMELARRSGAPAPMKVRLRSALRRVPGWPLLLLAYTLLLRGGMFEGRPGFHYACIKAFYEYLVQLHMADLARRGPGREA